MSDDDGVKVTHGLGHRLDISFTFEQAAIQREVDRVNQAYFDAVTAAIDELAASGFRGTFYAWLESQTDPYAVVVKTTTVLPTDPPPAPIGHLSRYQITDASAAIWKRNREAMKHNDEDR